MRLLVIYIICISSILFSCGSKPSAKLVGDSQEIQLKYAKNFRLHESSNQIKVEVLQGQQDVIFSKEFPKENELKLRTAAFSSTVIGYLSLLNELESIIAVENTNALYNSTLRSKALKEYTSYNLVNLERFVTDKIDLIFYSLYSPERQAIDLKLEKVNINAIPLLEWKEEHPLGKAEWIKFFGAIFGKYEQACVLFDQIERDYFKVKETVDTSKKPSVLANMMFQDIWYLPGGSSFMAKLIEDASGDYVLRADSATGSQSFSFEKVYTNYSNAVIWINLDVPTKKQLLQMYAGYSKFKAFKENRMYTYSNQSYKYFEEAAVRPDLVLKDLHIIFKNKTEEQLYFYSPLK